MERGLDPSLPGFGNTGGSMKSRLAQAVPALTLVGVLTLSALAALAVGCSSNGGSSPTQPPPGPTFNFLFPGTGVSNQLTFTDVGAWAYHCSAHASLGMTGTVVVDAASAVDSALVQVGPGNAYSFSPASVTITPGGH